MYKTRTSIGSVELHTHIVNIQPRLYRPVFLRNGCNVCCGNSFGRGQQFARVPGSSRQVNKIPVLLGLCNLPTLLRPFLVRDTCHGWQRMDAQRRIYGSRPAPLQEFEARLERYRYIGKAASSASTPCFMQSRPRRKNEDDSSDRGDCR
jgi:hypothetical protein